MFGGGALALETREKREQEERAIASAPNVATAHDVSTVTPRGSGDFTTADLPQPRTTRAEARAARRA
jgi:hypothetical protein